MAGTASCSWGSPGQKRGPGKWDMLRNGWTIVANCGQERKHAQRGSIFLKKHQRTYISSCFPRPCRTYFAWFTHCNYVSMEWHLVCFCWGVVLIFCSTWTSTIKEETIWRLLLESVWHSINNVFNVATNQFDWFCLLILLDFGVNGEFPLIHAIRSDLYNINIWIERPK